MTRKSATRITSLTNSLDEALCVVLRKSERLQRILRFQVQFYILQNHAKLREFYLIFLLSRTERSDFHKVPSSQKCCKRERPLPAVREIDKESTQHRFNLSIFERSICIYIVADLRVLLYIPIAILVFMNVIDGPCSTFSHFPVHHVYPKQVQVASADHISTANSAQHPLRNPSHRKCVTLSKEIRETWLWYYLVTVTGWPDSLRDCQPRVRFAKSIPFNWLVFRRFDPWFYR